MKEIFAFSENFANEYINLRSMMTPDDKKEARSLFDISQDDKKELIYSINGENATIKINGPLSKRGPDYIDRYLGYGGTSFEQIIDAAETLENDDSVKKVYLEMDTPGGEADGTFETAGAIDRLKKKKEVIAVNLGSMASAGYWIGSQAKKIYAASPLSETGSVGVVWVIRDYSRNMKDDEYGMARVRIVSKNAKNKRPDITKPSEIKWMQDMIDGIERIMVADIARGRNTTEDDIIKNYGNGAMFIAKDPDQGTPDAVKIGMIDGIIDYKAEIAQKPDDIFSETAKAELEKVKPVINCSPKKTKASEQKITSNNAQTPAQRDNNKTEVSPMNLAQFLAENPAATIEYDKILSDKFNAGVTAGTESANVRMKAAAAFLGPDSVYPGPIKGLAIDVLEGKQSPEALQASVATFDALKESNASDAAAAESAANGETNAEQTPVASENGEAKTEADFKNEIARARAAQGLEV